MLGFIADSLNTVTSILFPVYASYKALRTSDPAQLTPWLMYWTTLSLVSTGETLFYPILRWVPLYSWMRLGLHLYLVLPGQQGSVYIYRNHIHPFLDKHERDVDHLISNAHDGAKQAGLNYVEQTVEYVKVHVLNMPPKETSPTAPAAASTSSATASTSYAQTLLSRFAMPSARVGAAAAAGVSGTSDLLSLLGSTMQSAMTSTKSRDAQADELASSGALIPAHLSADERFTFIANQQDRLKVLLQAYEKEASAASSSSADQLKKSKSETEFVDVAKEDVPAKDKRPPPGSRQGSQAGWGSWIWGSSKPGVVVAEEKKTQ